MIYLYLLANVSLLSIAYILYINYKCNKHYLTQAEKDLSLQREKIVKENLYLERALSDRYQQEKISWLAAKPLILNLLETYDNTWDKERISNMLVALCNGNMDRIRGYFPKEVVEEIERKTNGRL